VLALAAELGMPLPAATRVIMVERQSGIDGLVRAKLRMDEASFQQLAPRLPIKLEDLRPGPGRLGTDEGAWDPHATPGLRSAQAQLPGARYLNLGVAEDAQGEVTLFVVQHGT
jgi:hypothetical protein